MNQVQHRRLLVSACILCALQLMSPVDAFSTTAQFSSLRRHPIGIGQRSPSTTCTYALFEDEECEDLCGAFEDDISSAHVINSKEEAVLKSQRYTSQTVRRTQALWSSDSGPDKCTTCDGSGGQTCRFCGGTHFLSGMGGETDALFTEGIGKDCPVCDDDGLESCEKCAGTGFFFSWSNVYDKTDSLHP